MTNQTKIIYKLIKRTKKITQQLYNQSGITANHKQLCRILYKEIQQESI